MPTVLLITAAMLVGMYVLLRLFGADLKSPEEIDKELRLRELDDPYRTMVGGQAEEFMRKNAELGKQLAKLAQPFDPSRPFPFDRSSKKSDREDSSNVDPPSLPPPA